jgi:hypothetical protein
LSVFIRYSLDAYGTFFPFFDYDKSELNYSKTIGNNQWVLSVRNHLKSMINASNDEFTGMASNDFVAIINNEAEIESFMKKINKRP